MKVPKTVRTYCPKCGRHTSHRLREFKSRPARAMARGQRRNVAIKRGYGGKYQFVATVKKQNKRPTFVATCSSCKRKHYYGLATRLKKAVLV